MKTKWSWCGIVLASLFLLLPSLVHSQGLLQQKRTLEITYDNGARQVIPLDQPSASIFKMEFTGGLGGGGQAAGQAVLTKGWDLFGEPLSFGQVRWRVLGGQGTNNLEVTYQVSGSKPNHEFTVGVHLFNPTNPMARPNITGFGGWMAGEGGVINREGKSAFVIGYDFGGLRTNASGDGDAQFILSVPPGSYFLQFTLRIGPVNSCRPSQGITHGCASAYRSGNRFGERLETITIP